MGMQGPAGGRIADEEETVEAAQAPLAPVEADPAGGSEEGRDGREGAAQRGPAVREHERPKTLDGGDFPVADVPAMLRELRRPFTVEAVRWKLQSLGQQQAITVAYIDARLVIERLNLVPELWFDAYEAAGDSAMWCHLTVGGITRSDIGTGRKGDAKAIVSDALKRAAVKFGVGVPIYAIPVGRLKIGKVQTDDGEREYVRTWKSGEKRQGEITPAGEAILRQAYELWLDRTGVKAFGDPLDHGDVLGAQGEDLGDDGEAVDVAPPPPVRVVDREADELRHELRALNAEIGKVHRGRTKLPPARFNEKLIAASVSHDALRALKAELEGLLGELKGGQA